MSNRIGMALALMAGAATAHAGISFTGAALTENFDTMPNSPLGTFSSPWSFTAGTQAAVPGLATWDGVKHAGTGTSNMAFIVDDGTSNTGGLRSAGVIGNSDRALGGLSSGTNQGGWGVAITNNSGFAISSFTLAFDQEQYRTANGSTAVVNTSAFAYGYTGIAGLTDTNYLTNAGMIPASAGDLVSNAPTASAVVALVVTPRSVTITGLNVAVGDKIYVRWQDADNFGSDATLTIDNVNFTATPTPGSLALLGLSAAFGARRRRS